MHESEVSALQFFTANYFGIVTNQLHVGLFAAVWFAHQ